MKMNKMKKLAALVVIGCGLMTISSCSDNYMNDVNTDKTKTLTTDPNGQLTTALLQTYGDFGLMDTYRSYITGFTQHFAGGWNVSRYAGSVHYDDDQARLIWDNFYTVGIKNLRDAIANSADKPNINAILRIHRVYLMSVLTDIYGDIPCMSVNDGQPKDLATPAYDRQEDIYNWFFTELKACVEQLGTGTDAVTGDVTGYIGNTDSWKKYANSLRMLCVSLIKILLRHRQSLRLLTRMRQVTYLHLKMMPLLSMLTIRLHIMTVPASTTTV